MHEPPIPIPAFNDNYIWTMVDAGNATAAVVDPGDAAPVLEFLEQRQLWLSHILITHHHADHTGGIVELAARYRPVIYGPDNHRIAGITHPFREGDGFELQEQRFSVLEVPGHTLDHIAYYCGDSHPPRLFCGDTLFAAGCGRLFEGSPETMQRSLQKLAALPAATEVYCTHEYTLANLSFAAAADPENPVLNDRRREASRLREEQRPTLPSSIGLELQSNPFLRCGDEALRRAAAQRLGKPPEDSLEVFATLRDWKDNF